MDMQKKFTLLVVEDDKCAGELLAALLKLRFPHALIYVAADGNSGLEAVRRNLPDIVITDITMPEMDGFQLMNSIAAVKPDTRIIVITAHSDNKIFDRITSLEVPVEIVPKPIVFDTLMAAIKQYADFIPPN